MSLPIDRVASFKIRLFNAQARIDHMRGLAFDVKDDPIAHQQAVRVLFLLEDSLFEMTMASELLARTYR